MASKWNPGQKLETITLGGEGTLEEERPKIAPFRAVGQAVSSKEKFAREMKVLLQETHKW